MATAAIYIRVSTEEQARSGYSIAEQRDRGRELASELGCEDPIVIVDDGVTGSVLERPGFQELLSLASSVDYVICMDPDRFARKLGHQLLATEQIERAGAELKFVTFDLDKSPEGQLFYALRGAVAEFEKAKITERLMAGKWQKAKQGGVPMRIDALGYVMRDGQLEIEPKEAALVRQIYDWFLEGIDGGRVPPSLRDISRRLNDEGIRGKRGGRWYASTIKAILKSPLYKGELVVRRLNTEGAVANPYLPPERRVRPTLRSKDEWITISVPPIISKAKWDETQSMYDVLRRLRPPREIKKHYILTGLSVCGICGAAVVGSSHQMRGYRYTYYICNRRRRCSLPYAPADEAEERVWETVVSWLQRPELLMRLADEPPAADPHDLEGAREGLDTIRSERQRLLQIYQTGLVSHDDIEGQLRDLKAREEVLLSRKAALGHVATPADMDAIHNLIDSLARYSETRDTNEKATVLRKLVSSITFLGREGNDRNSPHIIEVKPRLR